MLKYSFPYNINPVCSQCEDLHIDYEDDNIKRWCDNKDCKVLNTYAIGNVKMCLLN